MVIGVEMNHKWKKISDTNLLINTIGIIFDLETNDIKLPYFDGHGYSRIRIKSMINVFYGLSRDYAYRHFIETFLGIV